MPPVKTRIAAILLACTLAACAVDAKEATIQEEWQRRRN